MTQEKAQNNYQDTLPGFSVPEGQEHRELESTIIELAKGVWGFIGYSSSNIGLVATKTGYVLIDTGDNLHGTTLVASAIKNLVKGQLKAIILTHSHPDHRLGADAFLEDLADAANLPVYAHPDFGAEQKAVLGLEPILNKRFAKQFGIGLKAENLVPNSMLFNHKPSKAGKILMPNHFVERGKTQLIIDGVEFIIQTLASETPDHLAIFLPEAGVLFSGDAVYESFPNLYPLRGGVYRDVERWGKNIHELLAFKPQAVLCGHNLALFGAEIENVFSKYAEAILYIYNATINGINQGQSPEELATSIHLPEHLAKERFLGERYGAIAWSVREIFAAKVGWFDGNASNIVPLTPQEEARHLADLAGGIDQLLIKAKQALEKQDYRWLTKLADALILLGQDEAKALKADALLAISEKILPITGINYLRRTAQDLKEDLK